MRGTAIGPAWRHAGRHGAVGGRLCSDTHNATGLSVMVVERDAEPGRGEAFVTWGVPITLDGISYLVRERKDGVR